MTIAYEFETGLYINLTNKCPCACTFCLRLETDGVQPGQSLWLEREPEPDEVRAAIDTKDLSKYDEVVFCGFGEPCERLDVLLAAAEYIRDKCGLPIRLNTNGLSDLINQKPTAGLLAQHIDRISISLNAPDSETYNKLCNPVYDDAWEAVIRFALDCKEVFPSVTMSVVNVLETEELERCRQLCEGLGLPLRVR